MQHLELELQQGWAGIVHKDWQPTRAELCEVVKWENELLCHPARMNWAKEGDRNSKFYHAVIKDKKKHQLIQIIRENEIVTTDSLEIGDLAQYHFSTLFMASSYYLNPKHFEDIQPRITSADNKFFLASPTHDEVREAIKDMNLASSLGSDGVTGFFYTACWDIIQRDLCAFVLDYFKGAYIPDEISAKTLILLPKL